MIEPWLQSNRRVLAIALTLAGALLAAGAAVAATLDLLALRVVGGVAAALGAVTVVGLFNQWRQPRVAYRDGEVLFRLRAGAPIAVPVEAVEAFFLGQGPAYLPLSTDGGSAETVNLVARVSQKFPQWQHVPVKPSLGQWCEGYVTIRGAWCEPLSGEVVRRLNRRLREVREAAAGARTPAANEASR